VTTATGATVAGVSSSGSTLAAATSNSSITGAAGNSVGAGKSWSSVTSGNKNTGELGGTGNYGRCGLGMGRLIAVHGNRSFKAHGSVHRRQFAYRGFFRFL